MSEPADTVAVRWVTFGMVFHLWTMRHGPESNVGRVLVVFIALLAVGYIAASWYHGGDLDE